MRRGEYFASVFKQIVCPDILLYPLFTTACIQEQRSVQFLSIAIQFVNTFTWVCFVKEAHPKQPCRNQTPPPPPAPSSQIQRALTFPVASSSSSPSPSFSSQFVYPFRKAPKSRSKRISQFLSSIDPWVLERSL